MHKPSKNLCTVTNSKQFKEKKINNQMKMHAINTGEGFVLKFLSSNYYYWSVSVVQQHTQVTTVFVGTYMLCKPAYSWVWSQSTLRSSSMSRLHATV